MRKLLLYYFIFLVAFLSFFASGNMESQDGQLYLGVARNIYYHGQPTAPPNEYNTTRLNIPLSSYKGANGQWYSSTGLGYSIALLPAVFVTDMVYKSVGVSPADHFPLQSDWVILFVACFTNAIFGAMVTILLYLYFMKLKITPRNALFLSFVSLCTTNLFVYTKDSFAHMMFIFFILLSFLLLKYFSTSKRIILLFASSLSFGIGAITYNQTFLLFVIPYIVYFHLLIKPFKNYKKRVQLLKEVGVFLLGIIPFALIYEWLENVRASPSGNLGSAGYFVTYANSFFLHVPKTVFIEGLFGQLLSPGRSIFLYSPLLLVIIIFWHKIKKSIYPELAVFLIASVSYVYFYAVQYVQGSSIQGVLAYWHGETSWGPRYLLPLIPFGMLLVAQIYQNISKRARLFVFLPLLIIGLYVELLGASVAYEIKSFGLDPRFYVNGTEYNYQVYTNLLPRYSPIIIMTKNLARLGRNLPSSLNHGPYDVKLYDGFEPPANITGSQKWRIIDSEGILSFDDQNKKINDIKLSLSDSPPSTNSATLVDVFLNNQAISSKVSISPNQTKIINLPTNSLRENQNQLVINIDSPTKDQSIGITQLQINNQDQNLKSLDYPWISSLGPKFTNTKYQNYGEKDSDPWLAWNIHSGIMDDTLDFWWLKSLYYWDEPKKFSIILLVVDVAAALFFGYKVLKSHV